MPVICKVPFVFALQRQAGRLKAFPNAMGFYHMSIAFEFTGHGIENFLSTVAYR
jgi:hypothetical protein